MVKSCLVEIIAMGEVVGRAQQAEVVKTQQKQVTNTGPKRLRVRICGLNAVDEL